jgi:hypothetical protein
MASMTALAYSRAMFRVTFKIRRKGKVIAHATAAGETSSPELFKQAADEAARQKRAYIVAIQPKRQAYRRKRKTDDA